MSDAEVVGDFEGATTEMELGPLTGTAADFEFSPADAAADAGAEGLGAGFLGGEAGGEGFGEVSLGHTVGDFTRGEDALEKGVSEALEAALDAFDLDEIAAESDDHWEAPEPGTATLECRMRCVGWL